MRDTSYDTPTRTNLMVAFGFCEWRLHYHQEGRGGGTLGACSPPWAGCPPSPIKGGGGDPLYSLISHALICPLIGIFSLLLVGPPHEHPLRRSIAQSFLHHHHYVVVLLESPRIHCFRYPTGARDGGLRRTGRVTEYGGAARLWFHHRDLEVGRVHSTPSMLRERYPASGLRG